MGYTWQCPILVLYCFSLQPKPLFVKSSRCTKKYQPWLLVYLTPIQEVMLPQLFGNLRCFLCWLGAILKCPTQGWCQLLVRLGNLRPPCCLRMGLAQLDCCRQ